MDADRKVASAPRRSFIFDTTTHSFTFVGTGGLDALTIMQGINSSYVAVGSDLLFGPSGARPGIIYDIGTDTRPDVMLPGTARTAYQAIDKSG